MELVPYPGIDTLPRHLWKKIYTEEENALNGRIDFKTFDAIRAKLALEESKAMAAIASRIAHRTIS